MINLPQSKLMCLDMRKSEKILSPCLTTYKISSLKPWIIVIAYFHSCFFLCVCMWARKNLMFCSSFGFCLFVQTHKMSVCPTLTVWVLHARQTRSPTSQRLRRVGKTCLLSSSVSFEFARQPARYASPWFVLPVSTLSSCCLPSRITDSCSCGPTQKRPTSSAVFAHLSHFAQATKSRLSAYQRNSAQPTGRFQSIDVLPQVWQKLQNFFFALIGSLNFLLYLSSLCGSNEVQCS